MAAEFYYVVEKDHEFAARKGIGWITREARASGAGWIAVQHVSNIKAIVRYRGFTTLRPLTKPPYQATVNGLLLKLVTQQKLPDSYGEQPALVVFPSPDYLASLTSISNMSKMMVVPWSIKEIQPWINDYGAVAYDDIEMGKTLSGSVIQDN